LISTVAVVFETEVCSSTPCEVGFLPFDPWANIFYYIEWISTVIFTVECTVRFATCPQRLRFFLSFNNLIDLSAWMPFWIAGALQSPAFAPPQLEDSGANGGGTGFLRAVRLLRILRIFKMSRYSLSIRLFTSAIWMSASTLAVLMAVGAIAMIIFSSLMWLLEQPQSSLLTADLLEAMGRSNTSQAVCFGTIPSCLWWTVTTMTTVGYGDCAPITLPGKLVAATTMLCGIIVLALPITVLGSSFAAVTEMFEDEALEVAKTEMSRDGKIEENELRDFLRRHRKDGSLRRDLDVRIGTLLSTYGNGTTMTLESFKQMQADIVDAEDVGPMRGAELRERLIRMEKDLQEQRKGTSARQQRLEDSLDALETSLHVKMDDLTRLVEQLVAGPPGSACSLDSLSMNA